MTLIAWHENKARLFYAAAFFTGFLGATMIGMGGVAVAEEVGGDAELLKHCLSEREAVMYGAHWCSKTEKQKSILGGVMDEVTYVECFDEGWMGTPLFAEKRDRCEEVGVDDFPTLIVGDHRFEGVHPRGELSRVLECSAAVVQ